MSVTRLIHKDCLASSGSFLCSATALGLFVVLCWGASADAQGAIGLVIFSPALFLLLFGAFTLGRYASRTLKSGGFAKRSSQVLAVLFLVFYISAWTPGLSFISANTIQGVAKAFQTVTGMTPYEWDKRTRD